MKYRNLADLFFKRAEKYARRPLARFKKRRHLPYEDISWAEAQVQVEQIAYGLKALGARKGQNIGLLATTCHYWMFCDFAILAAGCCTVPIYHSSLPDSVKYIVDHAELEIVIVRNKIQLQKLRSLWDTMPKLRYVIVMVDSGDIPMNDPRSFAISPKASMFSLKQLQSFQKQAVLLNAKEEGDSALFILRKKSSLE